MAAPNELRQLVARFREQQDSYTSGRYKEAQLRQEFLNPFLGLLGWDVLNERGYAEPYKEVVHEDTLRIGTATKAPDYAIRIGGSTKFFLEAKEPSVRLKDDPAPAQQLRRYAWSAKLPLSVLTDFEEFAIYDCRFRPAKGDKAAVGRVLYMTFEDYEDRWDELAGVLSRDAVLRGSFDKYAASSRRKRGTAAVDDAFLEEVLEWRKLLAQNVAKNNPTLGEHELNYTVQRTIDRLIFLRICEDRGIEATNRLRDASEGTGLYAKLLGLFRLADDRYNSGLFHFREERDRPTPVDALTPSLVIDDAPLRQIVSSMYYPESPYEFSVLPPEILGHVYEQLLGSVIRLTPKRRVQIEEKPAVRKAGGVFYTPKRVVDYIVRRTVGLYLEGRRPSQRHVHELRVVDPACGSGSFLIAAFQFLLDWYRDQYVADGPAKHRTRLYEAGANRWLLATEEKKRILLTHIFGVDIDPQAVEVTKLSLMLKVLEGENEQTLSRQLALLHTRALPDLGENIKCGNSLLGPEDVGHNLFPDRQLIDRINPFDWAAEFSVIMAAGGFTCIVGNPPYIRIQTLSEWAPEEADMYRRIYLSAATGNWDIYVAFVEKALHLLKAGGRLGFIVPSKFFTTDYGRPLRGLLSQRRALREVVDFGHEQVFRNATTYTSLVFAASDPGTSLEYSKAESNELETGEPTRRLIPLEEIGADPWTFQSVEGSGLTARMREGSTPLGEIPTRIARGSSSGDDGVFILRRDGRKLVTEDGDEVEVEHDLLATPVSASDFGRYRFRANDDRAIIFPYRQSGPDFELIPEADLKRDFPGTYEYLRARKARLTKRKQFPEWYAYSAARNLAVHERAQMLIPLLANQGSVCFVPEERGRLCLMASGGFSITLDDKHTNLSPLYVLGLLNSRPLFWQLRSISNKFRGGWVTCTKQYVETLPIRTRRSGKRARPDGHDEVVQFVTQLLKANADLAQATVPHTRTALERQIVALDGELDRLVMDLYEVSDSERALITQENAAGSS